MRTNNLNYTYNDKSIIFVLIIIYMLFILMTDTKNKMIIGYDFDDCLQYSESRQPIESVVNRMLTDIKSGHRVVIITARGINGLPEIYEFLSKYEECRTVEVYYTGRGDGTSRGKSTIIKEIKVDRFYDDQSRFLDDIRSNAPHVELYQITPYKLPIINKYQPQYMSIYSHYKSRYTH